MIAMILGLIVIAGVTSIFLAGQQSYRTNNALGEVESSSRIAFELMARDIRQAGLSGCDTSNGRIANVLNNGPANGGTGTTATDWWADMSNAVHGYGGVGLTGDPSDGDSDQGDPAVTTGTAATNRVAGTDSLELIGASGLPVTVNSDTAPGANIKINAPTTELAGGDIIMICSPDHATIVQISNYNSSNVTVVHNTGNSITPGNCSKGLGYPTVCTTNGNVYPFPPNSSISKMGASDWYVGYNGDTTGSGKSLYRIALVASGGSSSTPAQEMVRNVTDMQISYLQGSGPTFIPAASVTNWGAVSSVRVTLTLQSTFGRASVKGDQPIVRTYSATTTIRNRVN